MTAPAQPPYLPQPFSGPATLRRNGERSALIWSVGLAPLAVLAIGAIFKSVTLSEIVLLIAAGMVLVTVGRGRLLGSSVRIDARQLPETYALVERCAAAFETAVPHVFIRDDQNVPIVAVGIGDPYALVISSHYLEFLAADELEFLIAREIAHVVAGHTRVTSLLSASGRENPVIALVFGLWLRSMELTADRAAHAYSGSLDAAFRAIANVTFHKFGRHVDFRLLEEQRRDVDADPTLRMGEWMAGTPYATTRMAELDEFARTDLAKFWTARFRAGTKTKPAAAETPARDGKGGAKRPAAPRLRRLAAFAIDLGVISAILQTPLGVKLHPQAIHDTDVPSAVLRAASQHLPTLELGIGAFETLFSFFIYSALLVALCGQTLGMMVMELRVVTTADARPGPLQSVFRYVAAALSTITSVAVFTLFFRVQAHDRISKTRVVRGRLGS